MRPDDPNFLPPDLPVPIDDGAAKHLAGLAIPAVALPSTAGGAVRLDDPSVPWTVVYCYPRTGRPGSIAIGSTQSWNAIPGARGCTPQSCGYRDHFQDLRQLGAAVYGLSTQSTDYQKEVADRLHLPFPLLSDEAGGFSRALRLPEFEVEGVRLLKRLTLILERERIRQVFYPVFPPNRDADNVIAWLRAR